MLAFWFAAAITTADAQPSASIVQLRTLDHAGAARLGSGVVIAAERVVTACHVTRDARTIQVIQGMQTWAAATQAGSVARDLCILTVPGLALDPAATRSTADLKIGDRVVAVGYPGDRNELATQSGTVRGLYLFEGAPVVRTDAAFDFGASGGGLFDDNGNLVGVLAFKARAAPAARFALPTEWIEQARGDTADFQRVQQGSAMRAFWERPPAARPDFLGLALRESLRTQ